MIRRIKVYRPRGTAVKITKRNAFNKTIGYGEAWQNFRQKNPIRGRLCEKCHKRPAKARHHLIPVSKGGQHTRSNVDFICDDCHNKVHGGRLSRQRNGTSFNKSRSKIRKYLW